MKYIVILENKEKQIITTYNFLDCFYDDFLNGDLKIFDKATIYNDKKQKIDELKRENRK